MSRRTKWLLGLASLAPSSLLFLYFTVWQQHVELARLAETSWSIPLSQFSRPEGSSLVELLFVLGLAALLGAAISAVFDFVYRERGKIV